MSPALLGLFRLVRRVLLEILYAQGIGTDDVLVVGSGETGRGVIRTLLARPDLGFRAIGFLDGGDNLGSRKIPRLGMWDEIDDVLSESAESAHRLYRPARQPQRRHPAHH